MPKDHTEDPVAQAVIDRNYENGYHDGRLEGRLEGIEEIRREIWPKAEKFLEEAGLDPELIAQAKQAVMAPIE